MYLVRFDDICPTMNWAIWAEIDEILTTEGVKPILSVIPDNRSRAFFIEEENPRFWGYIREKQKQGWSIGLHGYQHVPITRNPGILKLSHHSEFAGLPEDEQEARISRAIEIFKANGVKPDLWVAPWHSFDRTTIKVLKRHGIAIISDASRSIHMWTTACSGSLGSCRTFEGGLSAYILSASITIHGRSETY
jgi:predicted deacetylase